MYLGIEIGGTKLQLGVGLGDGSPLVALQRATVDPASGAAAIRAVIESLAPALIERHRPSWIGVGFGGPVDAQAGCTITSHQVEGWNDFPLAAWCQETLCLPTTIANDADTAGLAEALFGAGRDKRVVFYITVGSGIGGALVIDGRIYSGGAGIAAEIGHLRPGLDASTSDQTVESIASGFALAAAGQRWILENSIGPTTADLLARCGGREERFTGRMLIEAAASGNAVAREIFARALQTLGWAIAQVITLIAPQVIVIGGGVSLAGESLFFEPLRREVARYVFPPLAASYQIVPAELGEEVVVHGALALARIG